MSEPIQPEAVAQPFQMGVAQGVGPDGKPIVILAIQTGFGQLAFPLDGAHARRLGRAIQEAGSAAATGLLIASSVNGQAP